LIYTENKYEKIIFYLRKLFDYIKKIEQENEILKMQIKELNNQLSKTNKEFSNFNNLQSIVKDKNKALNKKVNYWQITKKEIKELVREIDECLNYLTESNAK